MVVECRLTCLCYKVLCVGLLADERFVYTNELLLFQSLDMACQVAIGDVEKFFQRVEVERVIHSQR